MLNFSWFKHKSCAGCQAKTEQLGYLQKLIDQLLIKNGFQGLTAPQAEIVESPMEKRKREAEEKFDREISELEDVQFFGGD